MESPYTDGFILQAGVVAGAQRMFVRAMRMHAELQQGCGHAPGEFDDFINALVVRGLIGYAPMLLELERAAGLVEPLTDDDSLLLRKTMAAELRLMAQAIEEMLIEPDGDIGRTQAIKHLSEWLEGTRP
jgi:hypothetical protein